MTRAEKTCLFWGVEKSGEKKRTVGNLIPKCN
jgi:hypothetical protein